MSNPKRSLANRKRRAPGRVAQQCWRDDEEEMEKNRWAKDKISKIKRYPGYHLKDSWTSSSQLNLSPYKSNSSTNKFNIQIHVHESTSWNFGKYYCLLNFLHDYLKCESHLNLQQSLMSPRIDEMIETSNITKTTKRGIRKTKTTR